MHYECYKYKNCRTLFLGRQLRRLVPLKSAELTIIQERMPPGAAEAKHRHTKSRQFFYVLSGSATMICDGVSAVLNAEDGLEIPPGVVHQIANLGTTPLEIVVTSQPPSHGDRVDVK